MISFLIYWAATGHGMLWPALVYAGIMASIWWRGFRLKRRAAQLVEAAITPLAYHDIDGTCGRPQCICGSCWVRLLKQKVTK